MQEIRDQDGQRQRDEREVEGDVTSLGEEQDALVRFPLCFSMSDEVGPFEH